MRRLLSPSLILLSRKRSDLPCSIALTSYKHNCALLRRGSRVMRREISVCHRSTSEAQRVSVVLVAILAVPRLTLGLQTATTGPSLSPSPTPDRKSTRLNSSHLV